MWTWPLVQRNTSENGFMQILQANENVADIALGMWPTMTLDPVFIAKGYGLCIFPGSLEQLKVSCWLGVQTSL